MTEPAREARCLRHAGLLSTVLVLACSSGCSVSEDRSGAFGNVRAGQVAIERQACGSCHVIPGIALADGRVGPTLAHFASRRMIAGHLPNSIGNIRAYLRDPAVTGAGNVMPNLHLGDRQVRDIAAYLATLR